MVFTTQFTRPEQKKYQALIIYEWQKNDHAAENLN
jgi:hypothetical protein